MGKTNAIRLLETRRIPFELVEYTYSTEDLSVEHIAEENALELSSIFKTLVVKGNKTAVLIAVIPGDRSLDFKALAAASGNKKITLLPLKHLQETTGYVRGGCAPLGMKKDFPVYVDQAALDHERIFVNAGKRGLLTGLAPGDLLDLCKASVAPISQP